MKIEITKIKPNPNNARKYFDKISELAKDIKKNGLIQKISVRPVEDGFEIIQGERRFRALKLLGQNILDCEVWKITKEQAEKISLSENIQREDLSPVELANKFKELLKDKTQVQLAEEINMSQGYVAQTLRFLTLPEYTQKMIEWRKVNKEQGNEMLRFMKHLKMMDRDDDNIDALIKETTDYAMCGKKNFHEFIEINILHHSLLTLRNNKDVDWSKFEPLFVKLLRNQEERCDHDWSENEETKEKYCVECGKLFEEGEVERR